MSRLIRFFVALIVLLSVIPLHGGLTDAGAEASVSLQAHQGRYFRWESPPGWRFSESNSGVTLTSPDEKLGASLALLLRSRGTRTPQAFLSWVFHHVPSYRSARVLSVRNLPNQRMSHQVWQFIEATVSYLDNGLPVTGLYKVGVANYYGMNDAMIVGYRAANADFEQARSFMPQIAKSIILTNAAEASGNNTLIRPKNNPLDNSATIKSWEYKQKSHDEVMGKDANARRGTIDLYDSSTGKTLNVWTQNRNYYWRKPGSDQVVGTDTYSPPGVGYVPLTPR